MLCYIQTLIRPGDRVQVILEEIIDCLSEVLTGKGFKEL